MSDERRVFGTGVATVTADGMVLDAWFPHPRVGSAADAVDLAGAAGDDPRRGVRGEVVELHIDLDDAPASTVDAYLRLHALSHRLVEPNSLNLDGIFSFLPIVAWTNAGPMHPD